MILVAHFLFFVPIGPFSYVLSHNDEIFHVLRQYCYEPKASGNTKYD